MPINRPCFDPPNPRDCLIRHEPRIVEDDGAFTNLIPERWIVGGIFNDITFTYYDQTTALNKVCNRIRHQLPMRTADGSWLGEG